MAIFKRPYVMIKDKEKKPPKEELKDDSIETIFKVLKPIRKPTKPKKTNPLRRK